MTRFYWFSIHSIHSLLFVSAWHMSWHGTGGSLWFAGPPLYYRGSIFGCLFQVDFGRIFPPQALRPKAPDPSFARPRERSWFSWHQRHQRSRHPFHLGHHRIWGVKVQLSVLFGNNSFGNSWHLSITCYRCLHMLHGRADFNGYERMEETLRKKVLERTPRRWSPARKGFWGRSFEASICEKIAQHVFFQIRLVDLCRSLQELCVHPVHPVHPTFGAGWSVDPQIFAKKSALSGHVGHVAWCCRCFWFMYVYVWSLGWVFKPICWAAWVPSVRVFVLKCIRIKWQNDHIKKNI